MDKLLTLCENRDFRRAYNKGSSYVSPLLITYVVKNRNHQKRVGVTTSKKIGNAVQRNRARRLIKTSFREIYPKIKGKCDFVFVARSKTYKAKMQDVLREMTAHMKKAGVI